MTVRWTPTGLRDLESVHGYIAADNPRAADEMVTTLLDAIDASTRHPQMGRTGRVAGTRELVVRPYVVVYAVREGALQILAIIHGARRWPDRF